MKRTATIVGSLQADMEAQLRDIACAVAAGTRGAGRSLRTELHRQVTTPVLGQRLAYSWREKTLPEPEARCCEPSLHQGAADHVCFDQSAVIRSKRGRFCVAVAIASAAGFVYPLNAHMGRSGVALGLLEDVP